MAVGHARVQLESELNAISNPGTLASPGQHRVSCSPTTMSIPKTFVRSLKVSLAQEAGTLATFQIILTSRSTYCGGSGGVCGVASWQHVPLRPLVAAVVSVGVASWHRWQHGFWQHVLLRPLVAAVVSADLLCWLVLPAVLPHIRTGRDSGLYPDELSLPTIARRKSRTGLA